MTVNEIIAAVAHKLKVLYPDQLVHVDKLPIEADGHYFVHCTKQVHTRKLGRRRSRSYSFEVLYFKSIKDNQVFNDWAETMYSEFEQLISGERVFHLINTNAEFGADKAYHYKFDVELTGLIEAGGEDQSEVMGHLQLVEELT